MIEHQLHRNCHILDRTQVEGLIREHLEVIDDILRKALTPAEVREVLEYFESGGDAPPAIDVGAPARVLAGVPFSVRLSMRTAASAAGWRFWWRRNLSERIKGREPYRPIAPVIREQDLHRFFHTATPSPYMSFAHPASLELKRHAPAIVHADGTARVQTVTQAQEPVLHAILDRLEDSGLLPVLANTSMNTAGSPMVDTPHEALEFFHRTPIDVLWLGDKRFGPDRSKGISGTPD